MHTKSRIMKVVVVMLDGRRRNRDRKRIMKPVVSKIASVMLEPVVMLCARALRGAPRTFNVPVREQSENIA